LMALFPCNYRAWEFEREIFEDLDGDRNPPNSRVLEIEREVERCGGRVAMQARKHGLDDAAWPDDSSILRN
jgi:hypothetical protein